MTILIADNQSISRLGIKMLLRRIDERLCIIEAANGARAIELIRSESVDLLILCLDMPIMGAITTLKALNEFSYRPRIVLQSIFPDPKQIRQVYKQGIDGYLIQSNSIADWENGLRTLLNGEFHFAPQVAKVIFREQEPEEEFGFGKHKPRLSKREILILKLICLQLSSEEIAERLLLTINTVKRHRQNLFLKTEAKNLAGLVIYAVRYGIFMI